MFVDALYDACIDALKVMPILFLAYLLVSFLSHDHSHKFGKFLSKNRKSSVFYASFLGCVPQCGFSSVIADLYSGRHVSLGTLVAVFVATSDEAVPIMISNTDKILDLLKLIGIKLLLAIFWGYLVDIIIKLITRKKQVKVVANVDIEHDEHNHENLSQHLHREDEIVHSHSHSHKHEVHQHGDCCVNNVFLDAFIHTFNILIYIFVATFILNIVVNYCGLTALQSLFTSNVFLQILLAGLIGLIPNCASSVLLVELYMIYGTISFPALIAGLTAGAGVGLVILFARNKKHPLENLGVLLLQFLIGLVSGFVVYGFGLLS